MYIDRNCGGAVYTNELLPNRREIKKSQQMFNLFYSFIFSKQTMVACYTETIVNRERERERDIDSKHKLNQRERERERESVPERKLFAIKLIATTHTCDYYRKLFKQFDFMLATQRFGAKMIPSHSLYE